MKYVELYALQNDGSQRVIAVCELTGTAVVCTGDTAVVNNLTREGILDHSQTPPQKIFPKDGLRFLERLQFTFKSGYLNASAIKEK